MGSGVRLNIIDDLKRSPRSGKAARIDNFCLNLPKQSIYDHLLQLAYDADIFNEVIGCMTGDHLLSDFIAFHDLAESVIGDIPDYTEGKALFGRVDGDLKVEEDLANSIIADSLDQDMKQRFLFAISALADRSRSEVKQFHFIDKTEPIISVWRYIHFFRDIIDIDHFLEAMDDFFTNPKVKSYSINSATDDMINFLQQRDNARDFFLTHDFLGDYDAALSRVVEGREIMTIPVQ